jgi:hypothetical protein
MQNITNISATEEAGLALRAWQQRHKLPHNQDCALVWVESYTEPDGSPVRGFRSGFMLGPLVKDGRDPRWALVRLPDGTELYVLPALFHWAPTGWHLIEKIEGFAMYSIRRVPRP